MSLAFAKERAENAASADMCVHFFILCNIEQLHCTAPLWKSSNELESRRNRSPSESFEVKQRKYIDAAGLYNKKKYCIRKTRLVKVFFFQFRFQYTRSGSGTQHNALL